MPYSSMLLHVNLDLLAVVEKISLGVFSVILWILPPVFTASFLHPDPLLSPLSSDLLKSFLKSILVPSAIVLFIQCGLNHCQYTYCSYHGLYFIICLITSYYWAVGCSHCYLPGARRRLCKGGNVTSAGWQVTLCDPMWHVSSHSSVATLRTAIHLLLTYLLAYGPADATATHCLLLQ